MNIEELKLILETVRDVASTAGTAGIWWIALHYAVAALSPLGWLCALYIVARAVADTVTRGSKALAQLTEIARAAKTGIKANGLISDYDMARIIEQLKGMK